MGNIKHIQQGDWQKVEASAKPVLVDFWAEWCPPCRMLGPTFERLAENYGDQISFAKVNVDELPEVADQYGIRSIPTLLLLCEGKSWKSCRRSTLRQLGARIGHVRYCP